MYELDSFLKATDAKLMGNLLESTEFYAIQDSESGSISNINSTTHSLQLDNVNEKTIVFSNSPYRKISTQHIENFIGNWTSIQVNLENNHPNAALVLVKENGSEQDVFRINCIIPVTIEKQRIYTMTLLSLVIRIHQSCPKNLQQQY